MLRHIGKELKAHVPFTAFGTVTGIVIVAIIVHAQLPRRASAGLFWTLHPVHVFLSALVTVGAGEDETIARKRAHMDVLCTSIETRALVEAFIEARLFSTDLAEDGTAVVSISHEALLHHWPCLQEWLEENREFLRTRSRVATAAARWLEEGKSPDFLLVEGKPLAESEHLLAAQGEYLDPDIKEFIKASILCYESFVYEISKIFCFNQSGDLIPSPDLDFAV